MKIDRGIRHFGIIHIPLPSLSFHYWVSVILSIRLKYVYVVATCSAVFDVIPYQ